MTIHREGHIVLFVLLLVLFALNIGIYFYFPESVLVQNSVILVSVIFYILILQFFRNPVFAITQNTKHVLAPADGKVVVIEETEETEYFKERKKTGVYFYVAGECSRQPYAGGRIDQLFQISSRQIPGGVASEVKHGERAHYHCCKNERWCGDPFPSDRRRAGTTHQMVCERRRQA